MSNFLREAERKPLALFADGFESGDAACWSSVVVGPAGGTCPATSPPTTLSLPQLDTSGVIHGLDTASATRTVVHFQGAPTAIVNGNSVLHLTVDHLGTPILATQPGGAADGRANLGKNLEHFGAWSLILAANTGAAVLAASIIPIFLLTMLLLATRAFDKLQSRLGGK